jgi:hypothetical protein
LDRTVLTRLGEAGAEAFTMMKNRRIFQRYETVQLELIGSKLWIAENLNAKLSLLKREGL